MNYKYLLAFFLFISAGAKCFCFQANDKNPSKLKVIELLDSIEVAIEQRNDSATISLINIAMEICNTIQTDSLKAEILLFKSDYHLNRQEKKEGLKLLFEYIKIQDKLKDLIKEADGYYKLMSYYYWNNEFERALEYARLALLTYPDTKQNQHNIAKSYMGIGTILQELDKLEESMNYQNKALEIKRTLNLTSDIPISLSNIAHTNLKLGDTVLAINQFKESVQISDSLGQSKDINFGTYSLGCVYYELGDYDESIIALEYVVTEWERINSQKDLLKAYPMLAKTYGALFLYEKSVSILNNYIQLKDVAFDETKIGYQEELEKKYKTEKKELENLELKTTNRTYKKKVSVYSVMALIFFLLTFLLSLFYYQIRKVKIKLAVQNLIIEDQNNQLLKLDQLKSRFFTNVTHELRTPLTLMLGPIGSVLKSKNISLKNSGLLKVAQKNGKNLMNLVSEILDLSKMESGKLTLEDEPVVIGTVLNRLYAQYESYAKQRGINFSFQNETDHDLQIMLDLNKFEKIYNNLLSNAFKFTDKDDEINIIFKNDENGYQLIVSDTGHGIHKNDIGHIFEKYYQSNQPDAKLLGGTGIGLSLCEEYVKLHGGNISVKSSYGQRTMFTLYFPQKELVGTADIDTITEEIELKPQTSEVETVEAVIDKSRIKDRILVVEDNLDLCNYLKIVLSESYIVEIANNGQEAMDKLKNNHTSIAENRTHRYDLIISDVMMPIMDGFELLNNLKSNEIWNGIPVIMLTARASMEDKLRALRIGVDDYMLKPFEEEELLARVDNLLKNKRERSRQIRLYEEDRDEMLIMPTEEKKWLEQLEVFTLTRYKDFDLTADNMANEMALSRTQFFKKMKILTGLTPSQYVREIRFTKARHMLENRTYTTIKRVAYEVGFKQVKHFSQEFKKRYGKLPSAYLK